MIKDIKCGYCARLLARGVFTQLQIKCTRCKTLNQFSDQFSAQSAQLLERRRASNPDKPRIDNGIQKPKP